MRLPRDVDAGELIKALHHMGYRAVRQTGSHIRLQIIQSLMLSPFPTTPH